MGLIKDKNGTDLTEAEYIKRWKEYTEELYKKIPRKGNAKECSNYRTVALISHASKVMLKILQSNGKNRLQQYMN